MKSLKIGVCGVGNVGGAVVENLSTSSSIIESNGGVKIEIIQVGARKGKSVVPFDLDVSTDLLEVAKNPNLDVLVELIGGCDLAKELIEEAINNGKNIVTANKALIATHGDELFDLAKKKGVQIGFEASVAGGTPVIKALREGLVANKVKWFAGILNGTTNYIHGFPYYAISIAYVEKGKTLHALVIDVARQDEYTASFGRGAYLNDRRIRTSKATGLSGTLLSNSSHDTDKGRVRHDNMSTFRSLYSNGLTIRRTGSAALDMANVAAGRLDGFWGSGLGMWDIAAGGLLVREAGGLVSDYLGNPDYLAGDNIICSTNKCFKPMLQSIKPFTSIVEED